jgi:hypothetical protein
MTYMPLFRQNMAKSILKAKSSAGQIDSAHTLKQQKYQSLAYPAFSAENARFSRGFELGSA